jgi:histidyl-tRNA synthetase
MKPITAIRGMNDLLPEDAAIWQYLEKTIRELVKNYGYREIRTPTLERTGLFQRSIGAATDIVEKEMYSFKDRNDESLTLRPEGTAGVVRAGIENGLLYNQQQRLWYLVDLFRYEKPQKGRYRQFHQFGIEAFGLQGPDIDAEIIILTARLWKKLGIQDKLELHINSLGSNQARSEYRVALVEYFNQHKTALDDDSLRRLDSNPLRILDSKNPALAELIQAAPKFSDFLDNESKAHFKQLCVLLDNAGIKYQLNQQLVRGLDYYNRTVFEWMTDSLGAQGTVCGGGRYDGLVEQLGGQATAGVGFGMGIERVVLMLKDIAQKEDIHNHPDVYLMSMGEAAGNQVLTIAETLREQLPYLRLMTHCGGGNFKKQMKRADKSHAKFALILGENELLAETISVKPLRNQGEQQTLALSEIADWLQQKLN